MSYPPYSMCRDADFDERAFAAIHDLVYHPPPAPPDDDPEIPPDGWLEGVTLVEAAVQATGTLRARARARKRERAAEQAREQREEELERARVWRERRRTQTIEEERELRTRVVRRDPQTQRAPCPGCGRSVRQLRAGTVCLACRWG